MAGVIEHNGHLSSSTYRMVHDIELIECLDFMGIGSRCHSGIDTSFRTEIDDAVFLFIDKAIGSQQMVQFKCVDIESIENGPH